MPIQLLLLLLLLLRLLSLLLQQMLKRSLPGYLLLLCAEQRGAVVGFCTRYSPIRWTMKQLEYACRWLLKHLLRQCVN